jgi:sorbitol-specific phosphotransferase system component IIC
MKWLSQLVDKASNYFAHRKGLLPLLGILLVIINFILPFIGLSLPFTGLSLDSFLVASNLFLHLGVVVAIFGLILGQAL